MDWTDVYVLVVISNIGVCDSPSLVYQIDYL